MPDVIMQLLACINVNTAIKTHCYEIFAVQSTEKSKLGYFFPTNSPRSEPQCVSLHFKEGTHVDSLAHLALS